MHSSVRKHDIIYPRLDIIEICFVPSFFIQQSKSPLEFAVFVRDKRDAFRQAISLSARNHGVCSPDCIRLWSTDDSSDEREHEENDSEEHSAAV